MNTHDNEPSYNVIYLTEGVPDEKGKQRFICYWYSYSVSLDRIALRGQRFRSTIANYIKRDEEAGRSFFVGGIEDGFVVSDVHGGEPLLFCDQDVIGKLVQYDIQKGE